MKKLFAILFIVTIGFCLTANAQTDARYSQYIFNGLVLNPAYAGTQDAISLRAFYRKQWANIEGSPQIISLSAHSPFGERKRVGLGLTIENQRTGLTSQTTINTDYSYKLEVGKGRLSMGIRAGFTLIKSDLSNANTIDEGVDPELLDEAFFRPNFGYGMHYYTETFYIGAAIPRFLKHTISDDGFSEDVAKETASNRAYQLTTGGVFEVSEGFMLKPSMLFRALPSIKTYQMDFTLMGIIKDQFSIGTTFRGDALSRDMYDRSWATQSVNFMLGYQLGNGITIGYAYDLSLGDIQAFQNGTHEVMFGYDIQKKGNAVLSPRHF